MTIKNSVVTFIPYTTGDVDGFRTAGTPVNKKAYVEKVSMSTYGGEGVPTDAEWVMMISAEDITITQEWEVTEIKIRGKVVTTKTLKIKKILGPISGTFYSYWELYV